MKEGGVNGLAPASIGSIRVAGIDAGAARALGPAIEAGLQAALVAARRDGRLPPGAWPDLRIDVPHGASAEDIVAALIARLVR